MGKKGEEPHRNTENKISLKVVGWRGELTCSTENNE